MFLGFVRDDYGVIAKAGMLLLPTQRLLVTCAMPLLQALHIALNEPCSLDLFPAPVVTPGATHRFFTSMDGMLFAVHYGCFAAPRP